VVAFEETKQQKKLTEIRKKEEEESVKMIATKYRLPYQDLSVTPINTDALKVIPEEDARTGEIASIQRIGKMLQVGVRNPEKMETRRILEDLTRHGYTYNLFLVSHRSLERAWDSYKRVPKDGGIVGGEIQVSEERVQSVLSSVQTMDNVKKFLDEIGNKTISDALEIIIGGALAVGASDVHIEPQDELTRIRYRLDGVLNDLAFIQKILYKFLLSRIKLISGLKLNINNKGQDGRFTIKMQDTEIEVRTSTLPGSYGENIVLRILDPKTISLELESLGFQPWVEKQMAKEIVKPNGMILTTGPTGSGKTTTLYAFLKRVHGPEVKIITLEDPIEYHLKGIEQTQVEKEKGYDFGSGLRSILRQDPDVILVGEIRDLETAETAMHAALTGHLVFSTLHTNDAAGTIPRLIDIGVKPNIIAPAINIAMAQRLVRRLCPQCKKPHTLAESELKEIKNSINGFPKQVEKPDLSKATPFERALEGCVVCHKTGYKGRISVYEILLVDDTVENLILHSPSVGDVRKALFEQGQITMKQDGILKVLTGVTDLEEVLRVIG